MDVILNSQYAYKGTQVPAPSLVIQTTYAELLDRSAAMAFQLAFPEDGTFTRKIVRGRAYWYFQFSTEQGREQKYVGPETPDLQNRIANHRAMRDDRRERRALVSALVRSYGLPRPIPEIGNIVEALAAAGVFRLRGVLIGTVAYQTYSAILGVKLPTSLLQTGDVDVAQFKNVSVAVDDQTPPMIDILKEVDKTFRAVPHMARRPSVTSYIAKGGLRVDFLTPNEGRDTDAPQPLRALRTDAQPLRFLDFLIHDPEPAVLLHQEGIYVNVPTPERYAVHKLIITSRRREGAAKRDKDVQQAEALLNVLTEKQPKELSLVWNEATARGQRWRQLLAQGTLQLGSRVRDLTLMTVGERRATLPGFDLRFNNPPARYDSDRDIVTFSGEANGTAVQCAIGGEALEDHFGAQGASKKERLESFQKNRSAIEAIAGIKYLSWPVEEPEAVLIRTADVPRLLKETLELDRSPPAKRSTRRKSTSR